MNYLAHNNQALGYQPFIFLTELNIFRKIARLSLAGSKIRTYGAKKPRLLPHAFFAGYCVHKDAEHFARRMAPIRIKELLTSVSLPSSITLLQMYSVRTVEELNVLERWKNNKSSGHWRHLLAYAQAMKYLLLTFTNVARVLMVWWQVPTGSGKSELLQSFIISLAINFHPHDVVFVLIDYKGGGMANAFLDLPHWSEQ